MLITLSNIRQKLWHWNMHNISSPTVTESWLIGSYDVFIVMILV